ncbi:hypothetical protein CEXT_666031 [Caerostris extrusa]|uniref:Uncharacterized protein n=1 Tax=Caerostris extrusa TaxID=172846 RepID=A0AAV4QLQ9_CAEEX|nr:hypothetical protein CEXT_666031 [Caerostris extrusa]
MALIKTAVYTDGHAACLSNGRNYTDTISAPNNAHANYSGQAETQQPDTSLGCNYSPAAMGLLCRTRLKWRVEQLFGWQCFTGRQFKAWLLAGESRHVGKRV